MAVDQVQRALGSLPTATKDAVVTGLQSYAAALQDWRESLAVPLAPVDESMITIEQGYRPGIMGRMLEMQMVFYSKAFGIGLELETELAVEMADLMKRLDRPRNGAWSAVERIGSQKNIVGTVFLDGDGMGERTARVRCFVVDEKLRGRGVGRKLVEALMDFVRNSDLDEVFLWTSASLRAARRLYAQAGFVQVLEVDKCDWNVPMKHIKYVWRRS